MARRRARRATRSCATALVALAVRVALAVVRGRSPTRRCSIRCATRRLRARTHRSTTYRRRRERAARAPTIRAALRRWKRRELRAHRGPRPARRRRPPDGRRASSPRSRRRASRSALAHRRHRRPVRGHRMGKLGGRELNYASDVDVLFVHDGDARRGRARRTRRARDDEPSRRATASCSAPTPTSGPKAASGALTRTLDSVRGVLGAVGADLGVPGADQGAPGRRRRRPRRRVHRARAEPFVWPETPRPRRGARGARDEGARRGRCSQRKGLADRELKRGPRRHPRHRVRGAAAPARARPPRPDRSARRTTLDALDAARRRRLRRRAPTPSALDDAYRFLRTVEHRLQLVRRAADAHAPVRRRGAARASRASSATATGRDAVRARARSTPTHRAHQARGALDPREAVLRAAARHARRRRPAVARSRRGAARAPSASPTSSRPAPRCASSPPGSPAARGHAAAAARASSTGSRQRPIPTSGCSSCAGSPRATRARRRSRAAFRDTPGAAERTCRLLGSSRVLGDALRRQPEFVDALADDDVLVDGDVTAPSSSTTRSTRSTGASDDDAAPRRAPPVQAARAAAHRRARPARVRATSKRSGASSSNLADACVEAALRSLEPPVPFAVIGMGRLGGGELSYASDIDVLFVYDGDGADRLRPTPSASRRASCSAIGETTAEGQTFRIDAAPPARRQAGPARPLARRVTATYYERWGSTWELQALTKARVVAGDAELGARVPRARRAVRVPRAVPRRRRARGPPHEGAHRARAHPARRGPAVPPQARARLAVRRRVHRAAPAARARRGRTPTLRDPSTRCGARRAGRRSVRSTDDDAARLVEAYELCERARNYRYLLTGASGDSLPDRQRRGREARPAARLRAPAAADAARRLPARHPTGRARSSSASSTGARRALGKVGMMADLDYRAASDTRDRSARSPRSDLRAPCRSTVPSGTSATSSRTSSRSSSSGTRSARVPSRRPMRTSRCPRVPDDQLADRLVAGGPRVDDFGLRPRPEYSDVVVVAAEERRLHPTAHGPGDRRAPLGRRARDRCHNADRAGTRGRRHRRIPAHSPARGPDQLVGAVDRVRFETTDTPATWTVTVGDDRVNVVDGDAEHDVVARGARIVAPPAMDAHRHRCDHDRR